jgi:DNA processing protein
MDSNYPVPVLFARGNLAILGESKVIACVGSREIESPYADLQAAFVRCAVDHSFTVASGFALGADSISHEVAVAARGKTICVMPGGLDRPFPPENRTLWDELLGYENAVFVSEAPFGARASSLTLRKRNKLIVSLSVGAMIGQSTDKGGAMNAFRFAVEQHKPIATFEPDGTDRTSGNLTISQETRVPTTAFRAESSDLEGWSEWLRTL